MKWWLVAAFVGVTVVVLLAIEIPLASHLRQVEEERLAAVLQRDAFNLAGVAAEALTASSPDAIANLQASLEIYGQQEGAGAVVTDAGGRVVAEAGAALEGEPSARPELATALAGAPASGRDGDVFVAVPVRAGATTIGAVRLSLPAATVDAATADKVRGLVIIGVIALVAAVIAALFLASTVVGPLRRLRRTTEVVAAGDLRGAAADEGQGPPEVRSLAASFNAMTEQLDRLLEQQRSFASDASHQLRTPLTALRLQLDRAGEVLATDPERARELIEAATGETERLQRMVEGLLVLARSGQRAAPTEPVDVVAVARERAEVWRPLAAERDVEVQARGDGPAVARAVAGTVEQVVDNFLDNALNVAPPGSVVEVVVHRRDGRVEAHVLDRGPGMTEDQLAHAFDRFWRAPTSEHEGSGLGLAIVQHLATASGGSVALTNRPGGGIDASLVLPAANP